MALAAAVKMEMATRGQPSRWPLQSSMDRVQRPIITFKLIRWSMSINVAANNPPISISFRLFVLHFDSLVFVKQVMGTTGFFFYFFASSFVSPFFCLLHLLLKNNPLNIPNRFSLDLISENWPPLIDNLTALGRIFRMSSFTGKDGIVPSLARLVELSACSIHCVNRQITESVTHDDIFLTENELWWIDALHRLTEIFCSIGAVDPVECRHYPRNMSFYPSYCWNKSIVLFIRFYFHHMKHR